MFFISIKPVISPLILFMLFFPILFNEFIGKLSNLAIKSSFDSVSSYIKLPNVFNCNFELFFKNELNLNSFWLKIWLIFKSKFPRLYLSKARLLKYNIDSLLELLS